MSNIKLQSNVEFLTELMDFAQTGPMVQMIIIEGITRYVDDILKDTDTTKKQMEKTFISGEAWIKSAREIKSALNEKYGE